MRAPGDKGDSQGVQVTVQVWLCCALSLHNHVSGWARVGARLVTLVMGLTPITMGRRHHAPGTDVLGLPIAV